MLHLLRNPSEDSIATQTGNTALKKLHNYDEYTNFGDLYIGFLIATGDWNALSIQSKSSIIKNAYANNNSAFIYSTLDFIKDYLQCQNNRYAPNYFILASDQKAKFDKNKRLIDGISNFKNRVKSYLKQCSVETVAKFTDKVLRNAWNDGDVDGACSIFNHLLIPDVEKLMFKNKNVKNLMEKIVNEKMNNNNNNTGVKGYTSGYSSSNSYTHGYSGYGSSNSNSNSSYRGRYPNYSSNNSSYSTGYSSGYGSSNSAYYPPRGSPPTYAAPNPNNYKSNSRNNSGRNNSGRNTRSNFGRGYGSKLLAPMTPQEASKYKKVIFSKFIPGGEIIIVEVNPNVSLGTMPGTCHDKNLKGICNRSDGLCKYDCYCTICHSTQHGRIHCPARGDKI